MKNGSFKRGSVDGPVICMDDSYDPIVPAEEENEGRNSDRANVLVSI